MKKFILAIMVLLMAASLYALKKVPAPVPLTPEQEADKMFAERNAVTDTAKAAENADNCIAAYKKLFEAAPADQLFYKYVRAVDFKNNIFVTDKEAKKQAYKDMIAVMDKFCEGNTVCASSSFMTYCTFTLWGRYGDIIDIMEAATSGIADKVKNSAEKLYASDRTFKNSVAALVLGRLHYKAPNIVFIMTWPDKNLSKKYLEEYMAANPDSIEAKVYLADTLWDLGDKEKAAALYREAIKAQARPSDYFDDVNDLKECAARMKELAVQ